MGGMSVTTVLWSACVTLSLTYLFLPLLYKTCPAVPRHLIFLNFVYCPWAYDFKNPRKKGLEGVDNFYLTVRPGVVLGIWHLLPLPFKSAPPATENRIHNKLQPGCSSHSDHYENELRDGRPIIVYLHGNTSCRAQPSRVGLYEVLRKMGFHVITFDYRGYADSSRVTPSEAGLVEDALHVYAYVRRVVGGNAPVIIWGHSLGTGVSCHAVKLLCGQNKAPDALVLEAPFNNIKDEVEEHPLAAVFRKMPLFQWLFLEPLDKAGLCFTSDQHLECANVPVLILHAEDDLVVPFKLGRRLYAHAIKHRPDNFPTVRFLPFAARHGFGHKFIHQSPKLPEIFRWEPLRNFLSLSCRKSSGGSL
ncbi:Serine aminopeptidase S33 [Trinorchestia longiramus]|nr:Serine aminopeptidase S33 [Trinorchestia longiramus]